MTNFTQTWTPTAVIDLADEEDSSLEIASFSMSATSEAVEQATGINFTRPWNATGSLDFASDDSAVPTLSLNIDAVSPQTLSTGWLSQTYTFTITGVSEKPTSNQTFQTVIEFGVTANATQATSLHHVEQVHQFGIMAIANQVECTGEVVNDINVDRGLKLEIESGSSLPTVDLQVGFDSLFADTPKLNVETIHPVFDGAVLTNNLISILRSMQNVNDALVSKFSDGFYVQNELIGYNKRFDDVNKSLWALYNDGAEVQSDITSLYNYPPKSDVSLVSYWDYATRADLEVKDDFNYATPLNKEWVSYYEDAIDPVGNRPIIIEPPIVIPVVQKVLNFVDLWNGKGELDFLRIELDAQIIMNTVIMYHTSSGGQKTYINPVSWTIANDLDSYAWSLNCSLYDDNILAMIASEDIFTINVNGSEWNFSAFKYKRLQDGQFSGYSVTFVSETQKLGLPLSDLLDVSLDSPKGALQLVEETLGDIELINKGVTEWTLQADTVEFMQQEPKAIISEILKASGAVMLPTVTGDKIMIQPRYKVASWLMSELDDIECDVLLDGNYMITDSGEIVNGTEYNAVTISGEKSGVVTKIVRDGTAGEEEATGYTTQIHQDHNVGLEYAKKIFSENGTIELAEISCGLDSNLLQSGSIVRIKHATGDRTGVSLGVAVKGDTVANVIQTATIEFRL